MVVYCSYHAEWANPQFPFPAGYRAFAAQISYSDHFTYV